MKARAHVDTNTVENEFSNTPLELKQRNDLVFDFSDAPAIFVKDSVSDSHMLNALSLIAVPSERYFVQIMRDAKSLVPDKYEKLQADMTGFIKQEGMHARVHHQYNKHLAELGYDTTRIDAMYERMFASYGQYPIRKQLAILAAGEHLTYIMGMVGIKTPFLDNALPSVRRMWLWHALEEIEHKSVAFDVCAYLGTGYFERLWGLYKVSVTYGACIRVATIMLIKQEKRPIDAPRSTLLSRLKHAFVSPGYYRGGLLGLLEYFKPNFSVWEEEHIAEHIEMLSDTEKGIYESQPKA